MHFGIDEKTWKAALRQCNITVPVRNATRHKDGSIDFFTQLGTFTYRPEAEPKPKAAPKKKPK